MASFDPIPLKAEWFVSPLNHVLRTLTDLPFQPGENSAAISLTQRFDLEPIGDVCVRFWLHIDAAPEATLVKMNGQAVGMVQSEKPFTTDVTDYVTLEDNVLLLEVKQGGRFGEVWLERVPCEEAR